VSRVWPSLTVSRADVRVYIQSSVAWVAIYFCLGFCLFYLWLSLAALALYREFVAKKVRVPKNPHPHPHPHPRPTNRSSPSLP
jgi:hypothetical protein